MDACVFVLASLELHNKPGHGAVGCPIILVLVSW